MEVGDRVKCIARGSHVYLTEGAVYTVEKVDFNRDRYLCIKNDVGCLWYYSPKCFEKVEEEPVSKDQRLKAGDRVRCVEKPIVWGA